MLFLSLKSSNIVSVVIADFTILIFFTIINTVTLICFMTYQCTGTFKVIKRATCNNTSATTCENNSQNSV